MTTPSEHSNDILKESRPKLPASTIDLRTPTKPLGQNVTPTSTNNHEIAQSTRSPALPPPVPPREAPPIPKRNPPPLGAPPKVPEGARAPPPLPPRPKVKTTAVDETPQNLVPNNQPAQPSSPSFLADADEQTKPLLKPAPPTTLPVGKQEPCKVLPTPNEPVRHYIYQELICKSNFKFSCITITFFSGSSTSNLAKSTVLGKRICGSCCAGTRNRRNGPRAIGND